MGPLTVWALDSGVRAGLFAVSLQNEDSGHALVRICQSTNTFARSDEYDFQIFTEEGPTLTTQKTTWLQFRAVLVKLFPGYDLDDLELPPHETKPIQHERR